MYQAIFRPCMEHPHCGGQSMAIYRLHPACKSGIMNVGHLPLALALELHPDWRQMTDGEWQSKQEKTASDLARRTYP